MRISGFTMVKNAVKLYYPIREAIESILPIVDEFIIALGDCDEDDTTLQEIAKINSPKIKIIHTVWDTETWPNGTENAHQTDIAKEACSGDWLFHLQADEVIHEKYLPVVKEACEKYLDDERVEGFLFKYLHFFGDYWHYAHQHGWYADEIRVIRNHKDIHSWESAQSFRKINDFDGKSYRTKEGSMKINVVKLDAYVYHYGWVRPPSLMQKKSKALDSIHKGKKVVNELYEKRKDYFDYGSLYDMTEFKQSHPKVMQELIDRFDWKDQLVYKKNYKPERQQMHHETFRYRFITFIETNLLGGRQIFTFKNWNIVE